MNPSKRDHESGGANRKGTMGGGKKVGGYGSARKGTVANEGTAGKARGGGTMSNSGNSKKGGGY